MFIRLGRWFAPRSGRTLDDDAPDDNVPNGTDDDTEPDETEEVEVLGIKLTRDDGPSDRSPLGAGVAPLAALAVLGGALRGRNS